MFPHYSQQLNRHPDKPTVQCPLCPQKFFYEGGLRHHLETHKEYHDLPTFECPECDDKFFYQAGLNHHAETHERQKQRERGLYIGEENIETMENSKPTNNQEKGKKHSQKNSSKNETSTKKKKKTINSAAVSVAGNGSMDSPSKDPSPKKSINSEHANKTGRGRGRPQKKGSLPKRHRGKLIKTEMDLNTSEDTERQKDIEVGNAALERLKKKKRDEEGSNFRIYSSYLQLEKWS